MLATLSHVQDMPQRKPHPTFKPAGEIGQHSLGFVGIIELPTIQQ
jgi:hypothetical protein